MDGAILTTIAIQFNILSQTLFLLNIIVVGSARTYFRNQAGLQLSLSHSRCCHYNPFQDFPSIANQKSQLGILMSQALPLKGPYFDQNFASAIFGTPQVLKNKTISDGGITVDFSIIKVHTSN